MLTQKIVLSYATRLLIQVVQMVVGIFVARIVGPSVIGSLAYALSFVSMFSFIADLGTGTAYIKLAPNKEISIFDLHKTYLTLKIFLVTIFVFAVFAGIYLGEYDHNQSFEQNLRKESTILIGIYLVIQVINIFYTVQTTYWSAETKQVKVDLPQTIQQFVYQVLRIFTVLLGFKAIGLAIANLIAAISVLPVYLKFGRSISAGKYNKEILKKLLTVSAPVVLIGILQVLIFSTDKVILKRFTDVSVLGSYSAAYGLASFLKTVEAAAGVLFFAYISRYIAERNIEFLEKMLRKFINFFLIFVLPFVLLVSIISDKIILLTYGKEFINGSVPFSILVLTFATNIFTLPFGNIVFSSGKYLLSAVIWFIGFASYAVTVVIFSHPSAFNLKGVGVAMSLLIAVFAVLIFSIKFSRLTIKYDFRHHIKILLLNLFVGVSFYYYYQVYLIFSFKLFYYAIFIITYLALFFIGAYYIKAIDNDSLILLKNAFSLKKMKSYISNELNIKK